MIKQLCFTIIASLFLSISTVVTAAVIQVQFRSELAAIPIIVPPFGEYETDVILRKGTIASGAFVFDTSLDSGLGAFSSQPIIHLENYLFFNDNDMMWLHEQNDGWSVTPTDWTVDLDESFFRTGIDGSPTLKLRAYRGRDRQSQNRPFGVNGDVGGTHDLDWISVETESTIWRTSYHTDRTSQTILNVRTVPEPSTLLSTILGLIMLFVTTRWSHEIWPGQRWTKLMAASRSGGENNYRVKRSSSGYWNRIRN